MAGSVFKRCACIDSAGIPLGPDCPKSKKFDHGSWYHKVDLPAEPDGQRRRARKGGFGTKRKHSRLSSTSSTGSTSAPMSNLAKRR